MLLCSMLSPDRRTCKSIIDDAAVKGGGAVHFTLDRCRAMIKIYGPDQDQKTLWSLSIKNYTTLYIVTHLRKCAMADIMI